MEVCKGLFSSFRSFVSSFSERYKLRCFVMGGLVDFGGKLYFLFCSENIKHGRGCKGTFLIFFLSTIFPSIDGNELDVLYHFTCFSHQLSNPWVFTFHLSVVSGFQFPVKYQILVLEI